MNPLIEKVLQPVSAEDPCGPDLFYDPRFEEIETILKGKPEVEIGAIVKPAEPPDWVELRTKCVEFLRASKHLRPAVILTCACLKLEGLAGFRDGIQLVQSLIEQYWPTIHPRLDPEDNNDPQERLNVLGVLTAQRGTATGWLQIVEFLHAAPLCRPKGVAPITLDAIQAAAAPTPANPEDPNAKPAPTTAIIATQFRNASPAEITASHEAVQHALEALEKMDQFLITTLGTGGTINFDELHKVLKDIEKNLAAHLPTGNGEAAQSAEAATGDGESGVSSGAGIAVTGSIRNRGDVIRMIEHLCDYYRQIEPGSPVPFLLRRAQKLANMDFVQAMQELSLATPDQLRPSLGSTIDGAVTTPEPIANP